MPKKAQLSARVVFEELGAAENSIVLTGMLKQEVGKDDSVLFARPGDCAIWVSVPLSMIENVEYAASASCDGHTHPVVRLTMKSPENAQAEAFANLARLFSRAPGGATPNPRLIETIASPTAPMPPVTGPLLAAAQTLPGATPCYFDYGLMRWRCPPWS